LDQCASIDVVQEVERWLPPQNRGRKKNQLSVRKPVVRILSV